MNPFALVDGKPYPLDMRGELDDTAAFKNFKKYSSLSFAITFPALLFGQYYILQSIVSSFLAHHFQYHLTLYNCFRWGNIEFPMPFGRVMSSTEKFIHGLDEKVQTDALPHQ